MGALGALLDAVGEGSIRLADDGTLASNALLLGIEPAHELPDCLHLALAEREGMRRRQSMSPITPAAPTICLNHV